MPTMMVAHRSAMVPDRLPARGAASKRQQPLLRRVLEFWQCLQGLPGRVRQSHLLIDHLKAAKRYRDEMGSHAEKSSYREDDVGDPIGWADDQIVNRSDFVLVTVIDGRSVDLGGSIPRRQLDHINALLRDGLWRSLSPQRSRDQGRSEHSHRYQRDNPFHRAPPLCAPPRFKGIRPEWRHGAFWSRCVAPQNLSARTPYGCFLSCSFASPYEARVLPTTCSPLPFTLVVSFPVALPTASLTLPLASSTRPFT